MPCSTNQSASFTCQAASLPPSLAQPPHSPGQMAGPWPSCLMKLRQPVSAEGHEQAGVCGWWSSVTSLVLLLLI